MHERKPKKTKKIPRKITERYLRNSGLFYLQKFTASSGHFKTVMARKIKKSCYAHKDQDYEQCLELLDKVTEAFIEEGYLDDAGYLKGMVSSLRYSGKSRKEITARLVQKRLNVSDIVHALDQYDIDNENDFEDAEFYAALKFARKKRIGPYDHIQKYEVEKVLNMFARKGFSYDTARRVLQVSAVDLNALDPIF